MSFKTPLSKMKRPHEESDIRSPQKSRPLVDVHAGGVGEKEVSLMIPLIKASKRPREDSGVVCVKENTCERVNILKFRVLLPNGTSVELKISEEQNEIPIEKFIDRVRKEYNLLINQKISLRQKRRIVWDYQDLHFTDAYAKKIRIKVDFGDFSLSQCNLLWLHDGSANAEEYEDMWDLTPDTDLLKELPDDYTCETALADLIDNSLQALWSNGAGEKRLISVEVHPEKISIFDSGPGMDGANSNIVKWGKMGASLHRSMREKAVGGEPPYLMPFFGMFGYGGPVATMCLGRRAVVSSKTKRSKKVFTLHMEREALVSASNSENCWKTKGGVRDPSEDEKLNSPHLSFTKVEIFHPKFKVTKLYIRHLRYKLKDIYFPYIQCDEVSGKTSRPIEFKVNGIDLAEIQGGEVATSNLHSCNGPEFIVQLHFRISTASSSMAGHNQRVSLKANARLKCVYFPIVEGEESIKMILDKLVKDGCDVRESFESFSRVSVRRLGRLLPDTRWALLPFMEPKQNRGEKGQMLKRLCSRVKCFIDTDAGFNPTPHKTDLAHHHPYAKALKNFGNRSPDDEKEVQVEITRDGEKLALNQLHNLYHDWVWEMHSRYDVETDAGLDEPINVVVSSKINKLGLSSKVLRVHKKIQRKGRCWNAGQNIKVLKGACAGVHKNHVYATLEYIIFEGLQGDCGEARLICRPLGVPETRGCCLSVEKGNTIVDIRDSCAFPVRIIDCEKCVPVDDIEWGKKFDYFNQKLPAAIDLLSLADCQELEIDGGLPSSLESGDSPPGDIVAVVRPKCFSFDKCSKQLDQKFIVRNALDMCLEIKHQAREGDAGCEHVYSVRHSASSRKGLNGLYLFPVPWSMLLQKPGIFIFSFFLVENKDVQFQHVVHVAPSAGVGRWEVVNHDKDELYTVRVGSCFKPLAIACVDRFENHILFTSVPKVVIMLRSKGKTLAYVRNKKVDITPDKSTMNIKDLFVNSSELDNIRPNYEAILHISTQDEALSVAFPCRVVPGTPKRITVHPTKLQRQLLPGQILEELTLEVCDHYGNHVKEDESILLRLDGFSFQDGSGIISDAGIVCQKKVDATGHIDLSNALKVSRGYGKKVSLSVMFKNDVIFELQFHTERRELRAVQQVFKNCEAGSLLKDIAFEVVDSEGEVDETIHDEEKHGQSQTLEIKSKSFHFDDSERYRFYHGCCTIPSITLPDKEGVFFISAVHSRYPELISTIEVHVEKTQRENHGSAENHVDAENLIPLSRSLSEDKWIPQSGCSDLLQDQVVALTSQIPGKFCGPVLDPQEQENSNSSTNLDDVGNTIPSAVRSSEHEQNLMSSPCSRGTRAREESFSSCSSKGFVSPSSKGFVSPITDTPTFMTPEVVIPPRPLGSQNPHSATNHEDAGNLMLSAGRPSEHEQVLLNTPTSMEARVGGESCTPCSSKVFVSPISDTPTFTTPKVEHTNAGGLISDLGKLSSSAFTSLEALEDELANSALKISRHKKNLEMLALSQSQIQQEASRLQAMIGPDLGDAPSICSPQSTLEQINSRSQSAASVTCLMPEDERRRLDIVGVVAFLGTVESIELSRMLALYLGEDQMLAIVCRNYAASCSLETDAINKFATDFGLSIDGGYLVFCLDDIRPCSGQPSIDPQALLPLQHPTLPNGIAPRGFLGYAVNLITIQPSYLHYRTNTGHGLRETLFYRLFSDVQVYRDKGCMMAARSCIRTGAVSLDGGMMRGDGLISRGRWEPKILFPVMNRGVSADRLRVEELKLELEKIKQRTVAESNAYRRSKEKLETCLCIYNNASSRSKN